MRTELDDMTQAEKSAFDRWSRSIDRFNRMTPASRRARADECKQLGHKFEDTPIGNQMCLHCCMYRDVE